MAATQFAQYFERLIYLLERWQFDYQWEKYIQIPDFSSHAPTEVPPEFQTEVQLARKELTEAEALCTIVARDLIHRFQRAIYNDGTAKERADAVGSVLDEVVKRREQFGMKRVGNVIIIDGYHLELTEQLADLLQLALRDGGIPFDEAQEPGIGEAADSEIRSRVDKLKKKLNMETKKVQAPFTIIVDTRSKRVKAIIRNKSMMATETSPT